LPEGPTTTPTGVAIFPHDFQSIRQFAERDHANIVSWNRYDRGSHFATRDATDLLMSDIPRLLPAAALAITSSRVVTKTNESALKAGAISFGAEDRLTG
jgi:hypothetical protein